MTDLLATLASYVPALVARRLSRHPAATDKPAAENIPAAALFADISGFTALAERLAQAGPAGAEELTRLLNGYFGQLIDLIAAHGGDVVKFAGDALLALWPADSGGGLPALRAAALRAEQCGLQIQKTLHKYTAAGGLRLSMRLSIAAGEVFTVQLGGVNQRWELLVAGEPIVQVSAANKQAQPGQVVVAPGAWALTQSACRGVALPPQPEGSLEVLEAVLFPVPLRPVAAPPLPPEAEAALRTYIPPAVLSRLAAGQTAWLAELRRITVVFINLPDLNSRTALAQAQEIMRALQSDAYRYEGSINKLSVDDKGASLVVATGLPPLAHEDDAVRGVQAALSMRDSLRKLGARCHIGIATGRAFCGSVGNDTRREYTMVGGVVNLAARLMQAATDDMLCDAATHQAASASLDFTSLPAITVKGRTEPVPVYRPLPGGKQAARRPQPATGSGIVGRVAERALLAQLIPALTLHRQSSLVIIEGEAGIGKSRLIEDLRRQAEARHARVLMASGSAIERATVYHAWRPVFNELFGLDPLAEPGARRESVLRQLGDRPQLLRLAPLLSGLLSLDMPDNDLTAEMAGQSRADNTRLALLQLLQAAAREPLTLIVEDAHWLDSASWALTALVAERVRPLLLVVATRPLGDPANPSAETAALPSAYMELIRTPGAHRLQLTALSPEDTVSLVRSRLGVTSLPEVVNAFIRDKAEGHPFFSEELAYALRDAGLIIVANGECRLAPTAGDLRDLNFPDTVQGVITSRIDRLAPPQQLALKVASVIGRVFAFRTLSDIHPVEADKPRLGEYLSVLQRLDITPLESPEPSLAYIFKHIITQEVAYNLMLFSQRRELHRAVAQWIERTYADHLSPSYPLLAYHCGKADLTLKAIDYLEKAGEQALNNYANQEAVAFFNEALALSDERRTSAADRRANRPQSQSGERRATPVVRAVPFQRARWHRQLGEAHQGLGHLAESREHFSEALALLGSPMPATIGQWAAQVLGQVLRQVWHRLVPPRPAETSPEAAALKLEMARTYGLLGVLYYLSNETVPIVYTAVRTLNIAERLAPSPELADAYTNGMVIAGVIPYHALARLYGRRALETARRINHPRTMAYVLIGAGVYNLGLGQWAEAGKALQQSVSISDQVGNWQRWSEALILMEQEAYYQGEFERGLQLATELLDSARHRDNLLHQAWAFSGQAENNLRLGRAAAAAELAQAAIALYADNTDRVSEAATYGLLTLAQLRQGNLPLARQTAERTAALLAKLSSSVSYYLLDALAAVAEVYLTRWEAESQTDPRSADARSLPPLARKACAALSRLARVFPMGGPRAWLYEGWAQWQSGRPLRARQSWRKSLALAERLAMPYDQALAHYELGRHAAGAERQTRLAQACDLFARLGAADDLDRARKAQTQP